ncbi:FAD-binding monooxygenase [Asanoa ishikariensis]|uniref:FAD binding domain-containing protein n=1 Tax=Asanoa ishikariensis TaxID=137265 RepID=A0A1H3MTR4_9ACTN|nr:FAD-dependent monooxygenase [Asanoa ishikariensis]GIF66332.1 FAD-binding monooxygenase [Asanoa ishikariensis]SDY79976.1 FAD binding domain-containing protein [Asanoa ishikariensis]
MSHEFLSQAHTEQILTDHLHARGVEVERGVELTELSQDAASVKATLRHHDGPVEHVQAPYVVGCDGGRSTVRELAGIAFEGSSYPQTFVLADTDADGLDPGTAHVFVSPDGMLFFFPLVSPAAWRVLAMRPLSDPGASVTLADVQILADRYTNGVVRLRDPVWMTNFRLHHRAAARYRAARIFLAGDAAHIHSPAGAQGMNTGIQDAVNLAWKLAHTLTGDSPESILDTYAAERAPIGRTVLRMSDRAFTIATSTNPVVRIARARVAPTLLPVAAKIAGGRGAIFRTVSQLNIGYPRSPLSATGPAGSSRRVGAGDRLPDAPLAADGAARTLHELTAGPGWHLLLCGSGWPVDAELARASRLRVHRLDHPTATTALVRLRVGGPTAILVRPDGYIGYRGGADLLALRAYVGRWLPRHQ